MLSYLGRHSWSECRVRCMHRRYAVSFINRAFCENTLAPNSIAVIGVSVRVRVAHVAPETKPSTFSFGNLFAYQFVNDLQSDVANVLRRLRPSRNSDPVVTLANAYSH